MVKGKLLFMLLPLLLITQTLVCLTGSVNAEQVLPIGHYGALAASSTFNVTKIKPQGPPVLVHLLERILGFALLIAAGIIFGYFVRAIVLYVQQPQGGFSQVLYPLIGWILLAVAASLLFWISGGLL